MNADRTDKPGSDFDAQDRVMVLRLLSVVEQNQSLTQRTISKELGVALGLANGMLKRCIRKGLIKITQAPANRYFYYLTPKGFTEKGRLAAEFLSNSFTLFRVARQEYSDLFVECARRQWFRLALWGSGDLADIAILASHGLGVELVGIVGGPDDNAVANVKVVSDLEQLGAVDAVVITDLAAAQDAFHQACGLMSPERVLTVKLLHVSRDWPSSESNQVTSTN